jgi:hypothetical protein
MSDLREVWTSLTLFISHQTLYLLTILGSIKNGIAKKTANDDVTGVFLHLSRDRLVAASAASAYVSEIN